MDEILESIENGQRKQAFEQMKDNNISLEEVLHELKNYGDMDEMITMIKIAFSTGYITSEFE